MLKKNEAEWANSCWNKANPDEMVFVLLERDPAAAATIRFWIDERIRLGLGTNVKFQDAELVAIYIDEKHKPQPPAQT